ncbi:MAG: immunoglobulin-like domain-containing protein, partial [Candidatus Neomarinimicrobiota bacterium]
MKKFYLVCLTLLSFGLSANVTNDKMADIESRVGSMSLSELQDRRSFLKREEARLQATQESTQNPSTVKNTSSRLAEIRAELSAVQKALLAVVGVAAINSLTDDSYNDEIPPVITVNGSNPATVELGDTYTDAGATANDAFHGSTTVSTSSNVDTTTVGSYTVTYTATDLDNNTSTATRTVNVVDTVAPVLTVAGDNPATVELGDTYTDAGATATDASGTIEVVTTGTVDADTLGEYTLTYTATDASGNSSTDTRVVNVTDTVAPVFTSSATFVVDENVTDIGTVTATDVDTVTYSIGATTGPATMGSGAASGLVIDATSGALSFDIAPDYDLQVPDTQL